jgi:hypothetical protein
LIVIVTVSWRTSFLQVATNDESVGCCCCCALSLSLSLSLSFSRSVLGLGVLSFSISLSLSRIPTEPVQHMRTLLSRAVDSLWRRPYVAWVKSALWSCFSQATFPRSRPLGRWSRWVPRNETLLIRGLGDGDHSWLVFSLICHCC